MNTSVILLQCLIINNCSVSLWRERGVLVGMCRSLKCKQCFICKSNIRTAYIVHAVQCNKFPMIHYTKELAATVVQYDNKLLV